MAHIFDATTIQSTGAFLVGELERLDPTLYEPISDFTWGRDIDLRTDVTIADEVTSFVLSTFAGGFGGTALGQAPTRGKSWITGKDSTPAQVAVGATKVSTPLTPWGQEVSYSILELQKAMQVGRPIDVQKFDALRTKHQLDVDTQVYVGDAEVGVDGLLNSSQITPQAIGAFPNPINVATVIDYFNTILDEAWKATQYTRIPNRILVAPAVFSALASTQLTNTPMNLLNYVKTNNLSVANGGGLDIYPCKWLANTTLFPDGRIVAYTKSRDVVRFPMVELQSLPVQFRDYMQVVPYYGALGGVEFVRPEMVFYADLAEGD